MTRETMKRILAWLAPTSIPTVDITGGAPEMFPFFREIIERLKAMQPARHVIDRCNLTILQVPGFENIPAFLARHRVEIIASLPCYRQDNVDHQRGDGVFRASIESLQHLNRLGYGTDPDLPLHLVYNPVGAFLPGPQAELEHDYKQELHRHFGIVFNRLLTLTNMPISRFGSWLHRKGKYGNYLDLLIEAFNPDNVDELMCRHTLSVGWRGELYDCDFNQMLDMQWENGKPLHLWDISPDQLAGREIATGEHCFGCTAGSGSSCSGALSPE